MTRNELRQAMMTCIVTLEKLNGRTPAPAELVSALGEEYEAVLSEYLAGDVRMAA